MIDNPIPEIRNVVRGVIVRNDKILFLKKMAESGDEYFALPGGGQNPGETLFQALERECLEEIATTVDIKHLLYVADYFKTRSRDANASHHRQLVEFVFECTVSESYIASIGCHPDKHQIDVIWVSINKIDRLVLVPESLPDHLTNLGKSVKSLYLGTIK
jgi:8-oxo-dGTP diphosphatase